MKLFGTRIFGNEEDTRESALHLHFIGIGGIGMSGIAEVFRNHGYSVSGSDLSASDTTRRLESIGIRIEIGHRPENVAGASVVVHSSAVRKDNPEMMEAKRLGIPTIPRAEALGEIMRGKIGVAIAGTHGKTTTTTMMATVLAAADLDPTIIIGGKVDAFGGNARLGKGDYVVAEADESDGSFLYLPAIYGAITNIDSDHLDHYGDLDAIDEAFCAFVSRVPFFGKVLVCGDDAGVKRNLTRFSKPFKTYGLGEENHLRAIDLTETPRGSSFKVVDKDLGILGEIDLPAHGSHNVRNALAVIGIAQTLQIPFEMIQNGLKQYRGVRRRFELRYEDKARGISVLDDYGHHPTEIIATLDAARSFIGNDGKEKGRRILIAFQPHRYSRTQNSAEEFASCFHGADKLFLTEVYAAGEDPIPGVDGSFLATKVERSSRRPGEVAFAPSLDACADAIVSELREGDLVLCMGAGSVTQLPDMIAARISAKPVEALE
jgi:UDP-N-acetylmuramate--alanine ligase